MVLNGGVKRRARRYGLIAWLIVATSIVAPQPALAAPPVIDVWYGTTQTFGTIGTPQNAVNILGNVPNSDGVSLSYVLNPPGTSIPLTVGHIDAGPNDPDPADPGNPVWTNDIDTIDRRLAKKGDFNVDLDVALLDGSAADDIVRITAVGPGGTTSVNVTVDYETPPVWPIPYTIDWSTVSAINDAAQVVDGDWSKSAGGVRTAVPGYDRLIAIGDVSWSDYEVEVPVTIHDFSVNGSAIGGGVGFMTGWSGHTNDPGAQAYKDQTWYTDPPYVDRPAGYDGACGGADSPQPRCGWQPLGAIAWYRNTVGALEFFDVDTCDGEPDCRADISPLTDGGATYIFKLRVENLGASNRLRFKVWPQGGPEPGWQLSGTDARTDGSVALIAHHDDVTFGDITISPAGPPVANNDVTFVRDLQSEVIDVIANDTTDTPPLDPSTVTVTSPATNGTTGVDPATGRITYTHTATETTTDTFGYTVRDASGRVSNQATVTVAIGEARRTILDLDRLHTKSSYFPKSSEQSPPIVDQPASYVGTTDFVQGNWYTRIHVKSKPSDKLLWMQLCMWQGLVSAPTGETCTRVEGGQVAFSTPGVYYFDLGAPPTWFNKPGAAFDWSKPADTVRFLLKDPVSGLLMYTSNCGAACYPGTDIDDHMPVDMDVQVFAVGQSTATAGDDVVLVEPNGRWHIRRPGQADYTFFYGVPGDVPLFGDWDGDGFDTPGMYRPSNGFAYLTDTLPPNGGVGVAEFDFYYGNPGDQVFVGDWDGINGDSLGISRNGKMYLRNTNDTGFADLEFWFGNPGDIAFGADPDGDGVDSVMVYRPSNSFAYFTNDTSGTVGLTDGEFFFGNPGDKFVTGDWDRDGIGTGGVFRGSNTTVFLKNTLVTGPADTSYVWGASGWTPVAGVHGVS